MDEILLWPRGLNRKNASRYCGVSASHFDRMVTQGELPQGKRLGGRVIWDRAALDVSIESLPESQEEAKQSSEWKAWREG